MVDTTAFWKDLAKDLDDPEFLREYVSDSMRVATIDRIVNELADALSSTGMTKTALARAINTEPATIRRLFSATSRNPTLGTLASIAAALGMKVTLTPLAKDEREMVTEPLLHGSTADPKALVKHLKSLNKAA